MRIVSLLPSATEIVYALGIDDRLEGVTDECDWPTAAGGKRVVVRSRQPDGLGPGEIDAWVRAAAGGGLYRLDDAAMAEISPELILTQDLCRVCAVPTGDVAAALARIGCPSDVVTLEPQRLDEVLLSVSTVAEAAGVADRGRDVVAGLRIRLERVGAAVAGLPSVPTLVLEWLDPPYTAGHWVPDVIAAAGGTPILGEAGRRSHATTWSEVLATDPAVVVLAPCGVPLETAVGQADLLPARLREGRRVVVADLARPGPRLVDAVEALAAILHPEAGLATRPEVVAIVR